MATKDKKAKEPKELASLENALGTTEAFVEKNQKSLLIAFVVIIVAIAGWLLYRNLYQLPHEAEAQEYLVAGQLYFATQNYDVALNGDSIDFIGFTAIAEEYGSTKSGNLAAAYAGLSYFKKGDFDAAIEYLKDFSGKDEVLAYSIPGTIGDCYVQKGDNASAVKYFEKAAKSDNVMVASTYLMKLARVYVALDQNDKALEVLESIQKDYKGQLPGMTDIDDVDKFIEALSK